MIHRNLRPVAGYPQTPPEQVSPPLQTVPQPPQLPSSVLVSEQTPAQHSVPPVQALPQAPQFWSVAIDVQLPEQQA